MFTLACCVLASVGIVLSLYLSSCGQDVNLGEWLRRVRPSTAGQRRPPGTATPTAPELTAQEQECLQDMGTTNVMAYEAYSRGKVTADPNERIRCYSEAIAHDAAYVRAFYARAIAWERKQDHQCAIADFHTVLRLDPTYGPAYHGLALAYWAMRDYPSVRMIIDMARRAGVDDAVPPHLVENLSRTPAKWVHAHA